MPNRTKTHDDCRKTVCVIYMKKKTENSLMQRKLSDESSSFHSEGFELFGRKSSIGNLCQLPI